MNILVGYFRGNISYIIIFIVVYFYKYRLLEIYDMWLTDLLDLQTFPENEDVVRLLERDEETKTRFTTRPTVIQVVFTISAKSRNLMWFIGERLSVVVDFIYNSFYSHSQFMIEFFARKCAEEKVKRRIVREIRFVHFAALQHEGDPFFSI